MEYVELQFVDSYSAVQMVIERRRQQGEALIAVFPARVRSNGTPFAFYLFFSPIQPVPAVQPPAISD